MIDNYAKLPIGKYLQLCAIDPTLPDIDRQVEMVSILTDTPVDDLLNMPVPEYSALAGCTAFLGEEPPQPQERVLKEYRLGGLTLIPVTDIRKMTTAQFIDFQTYIQEPDKHDIDILSVFLIPKGHAYCDDYDPVDVQVAIRDHLRADDAVALTAFFLARWMRLSKRILASSRRIAARSKRKDLIRKIGQLRTMRRSLLTRSPRNGGGSASSTR